MHHFSTLEDPRIDRQKHHSLSEILFLILCCSLCCIKDDLISIDGKNLRHSFDNGDVKSSIYMVSAWGSNTGLVFVAASVKSP